MRLLVNCPAKRDGTSVYRAWGVLPYLGASGLELVECPSSINWTDMVSCDAVFIQRPIIQGAINLAMYAKQYRKPVWIDYDDDLFCVPKDNPAHDMYNQDAYKENIKRLCSIADVVTVSTKALADKLKPFSNQR